MPRAGEGQPRAREGLLAADHSKRGKRFVTLVDPETHQVTLLDPWEHAILLLCDGTRDAEAIADLLAPSVDDQPIDGEVVLRCLKFFERQRLIHEAGLRVSKAGPPRPTSVARLQEAQREWVDRGVDEAAEAPFVRRSGVWVQSGLDPTVAVPESDGSRPRPPMAVGSTLVLDEGASLISGTRDADDDLEDVLAAADHAMAEALALEDQRSLVADLSLDARPPPKAAKRGATAEPEEAEGRPPVSGVHRRPELKVQVAPELALKPTKVGRPAPEPAAVDWAALVPEQAAPKKKVIKGATPAAPRRSSSRVRATVRELIVSWTSKKSPLKPGAPVDEVLRGLGEEPRQAVLRHFRALAERVPESKVAGGLAATLENAAAGQAPARAAVFRTALLSTVRDAAAAGRCPACLAKNAPAFPRCAACGFEPRV